MISLMASSSHANKQSPQERKPGRIIYKMKSNLAFEKQVKSNNLFNIHQGKKIKHHKQFDIGEIHFPDIDYEEERLCQELMATGAFEFCQPDYLISPCLVPDDTNYGNQWFHTKIDSPEVWNYTTGSPSIIVAICDSGVDASHADLQSNLILPGYNTVDQSTDTNDIFGHGTRVTGLVGAIGNNAQGIAGMNWQASILPIKISNRSDGKAFTSDLLDSLSYAINYGVNVINLSYDAGTSLSVNAAATFARSQGILLVVGAGNDNTLLTPSADYSSILLVGATTSSDSRASFSNYGVPIDVMAPGTSIYSTLKQGGYGSANGTSYACPIVSGLAALIFSLDANFTPDQVESFISSTAIDLGDSDNLGHGRIDAGAAVQAAYAFTQTTLTMTSTATITSTPMSSFTVTTSSTPAPIATIIPTVTPIPITSATPSYSPTPSTTSTPLMTATITSTVTPLVSATPQLTMTATTIPTNSSTITETIQPSGSLRDKIMAWPNPGKESITFTLPDQINSQVSIKIYNFVGNRVAEINGLVSSRAGSQLLWNCHDLAPGIYVAIIYADNRKLQSIKVALTP